MTCAPAPRAPVCWAGPRLPGDLRAGAAYVVLTPLSSCLMAGGQDRKGNRRGSGHTMHGPARIILSGVGISCPTQSGPPECTLWPRARLCSSFGRDILECQGHLHH